MLPQLLAVIALAADLSPQEARGRTLYRKGLGASGTPVTAYLNGQTEVKGNVVPCAGCHALDGRGKAEGGVIPSSVRWEDLTRPYEVTAPSGRRHSQYTERSLVRAIAMGFDPSGNVLHNVMPRYALTRTDADDLIAYLKRIAADHDPGVSDDAIRIGSLLPPESRLPGLARVVKAALSAYFNDVNRTGGLYGRRLEFVSHDLPAGVAEQPAAYSQFIQSSNVFALVSSFLAGAEQPVADVIEKQNILLVGGWTLLPPASSSVLFLDGGLPAQAAALASFAQARYSSSKPLIISNNDPLSQAAVKAVRERLPDAEEISPGALVAGLKTRSVAFLLLPAAELRNVLAAAKRINWTPAFFIPSALAGSSIIKELSSQHAYLASPFLPTDVTPEALSDYRRLASSAKLPADGVASQLTAICEARILVEALKRAGRDLSRERLLESVESIYDFPAGYKQLASFGRKRIGIQQMHIVTVDPNGALREVP